MPKIGAKVHEWTQKATPKPKWLFCEKITFDPSLIMTSVQRIISTITQVLSAVITIE